MNSTTALKAVGARSALLALVLTAALGATAQAAVTGLTLDPTARMSPGALHATLAGTITCAPGDLPSFSGQILQTGKNGASGFGSATPVCDGTSQRYAIDVSTNGGFPFPFPTSGGPFKAGKAIGQVTTSICDWMGPCVTKYVDGEIRLIK
ncbi:MAG: hypothetical protein QOG94_3883 [Solirubrobacteraceae bacterium]|jgi:hypothetical protein|nr:hypothetical protein [Solirubrobacteraceae bacterium]